MPHLKNLELVPQSSKEKDLKRGRLLNLVVLDEYMACFLDREYKH